MSLKLGGISLNLSIRSVQINTQIEKKTRLVRRSLRQTKTSKNTKIRHHKKRTKHKTEKKLKKKKSEKENIRCKWRTLPR